MAAKYKNGDRVRFLNDTGGGVITAVRENGLVVVQTEDGFEIPVSPKDLIPAVSFDLEQKEERIFEPPAREAQKPAAIHPEKKSARPVLPNNVSEDQPVNMILGFIPGEEGPVFNSKIACYLINDSPYFAYFMAGSLEGGNFYHLNSGLVESDTKSLVAVFDQTAISKIRAFHVQLIWLSKGKYHRKEPVDILIDVHQINFSKESYYRENSFFDERAVLFLVEGHESIINPMGNPEVPEKVKSQKAEADAEKAPQAKKREAANDVLEVDLHMDEADLQKSQFTQAGILSLQMSRFHTALEEAISKKYRRLVIIHGVGQGTLKMQIRKELQEKYPEYLFQDASFREYGFGATMIHLTTDKKQ